MPFCTMLNKAGDTRRCRLVITIEKSQPFLSIIQQFRILSHKFLIIISLREARTYA